MDRKMPRGIRNNNPLNIRIGNKWLGEVNDPTDKDFEQFTEMVFGLRAGFVLLRRYIQRYHLQTISDIISRWAPPSENHTSRYVEFVAQRLGISPFDKIEFEDADTMFRLVSAMCRMECGEDIDIRLIHTAYNMVRENVKP